MNPIENMSTQLTTTGAQKGNEPKSKEEILGLCIERLNEQAQIRNGVLLDGLKNAINIGEAATVAKENLDHGEFTPWAEKHFGPKTANPMTVQWLRTCMRVFEVFKAIEKHKDRDALMAKHRENIKGFAALLVPISEGVKNLMAYKRERAAVGESTAQNETRTANESAAMARKLAAAEKKAQALEAKLADANSTIAALKLENAALKKANKEHEATIAKLTKQRALETVLKAKDPVQAGIDRAKKAGKAKGAGEVSRDLGAIAEAKVKAKKATKATKATKAAPKVEPEVEAEDNGLDGASAEDVMAAQAIAGQAGNALEA